VQSVADLDKVLQNHLLQARGVRWAIVAVSGPVGFPRRDCALDGACDSRDEVGIRERFQA